MLWACVESRVPSVWFLCKCYDLPVPGAVTAQPCVLFFEIALSVECFVYPTDLRIRVDNWNRIFLKSITIPFQPARVCWDGALDFNHSHSCNSSVSMDSTHSYHHSLFFCGMLCTDRQKDVIFPSLKQLRVIYPVVRDTQFDVIVVTRCIVITWGTNLRDTFRRIFRGKIIQTNYSSVSPVKDQIVRIPKILTSCFVQWDVSSEHSGSFKLTESNRMSCTGHPQRWRHPLVPDHQCSVLSTADHFPVVHLNCSDRSFMSQMKRVRDLLTTQVKHPHSAIITPSHQAMLRATGQI